MFVYDMVEIMDNDSYVVQSVVTHSQDGMEKDDSGARALPGQ